MLTSVGFSEEYLQKPVGSLSGGWKMKLALARAILMKAQVMAVCCAPPARCLEGRRLCSLSVVLKSLAPPAPKKILLLDEPTNHLDVKNVAWLENYLTSLTDVTSIMVSHDSGFLDRVCTHILNYEGRKLKCYRGNLSEFVKQVTLGPVLRMGKRVNKIGYVLLLAAHVTHLHLPGLQYPAAKSYYELTNANVAFKFPEPGYLEGVKTKDKAILKMVKMGFKYPGAEKNTVSNISLFCTLSSRVVVHGANGAGKSTMIKVLCGEAEPTEGTVWKHPNLRIAYVAQHAFHHLEQVCGL